MSLMDSGTEIHFVALLDEGGNILRTTPINHPVVIPEGEIADVTIDFQLNIALKPWKARRTVKTQVKEG